MKIRPLFDRVTVRRNSMKEETEGGIIIPNLQQEASVVGEIIAVGPKVEELVVGDEVMFSKHAGQVIEGQAGLLLMTEKEIIGVLHE